VRYGSKTAVTMPTPASWIFFRSDVTRAIRLGHAALAFMPIPSVYFCRVMVVREVIQ